MDGDNAHEPTVSHRLDLSRNSAGIAVRPIRAGAHQGNDPRAVEEFVGHALLLGQR